MSKALKGWSRAISAALIVAAAGACSPDGGESAGARETQAFLADPPLESPVTILAIDPSTPATLYAGTYGGGLFRSTNGGGSWSASGLGNAFVTSLALDPQVPATLFATAEGQPGVLKSVDGGATWNPSGLASAAAQIHALVVAPRENANDPATVYAGTASGHLYKSVDGGGTWTGSLIADAIDGPEVRALAIDPLIPTTIYAGLQLLVFDGDWILFGKVLRSDDGGASWITVGSAPYEAILSVAIAPRSASSQPRTVFAGGSSGSVFRIVNDGAWTFSQVTGEVFDLAVDPQIATTLYAGTLAAGISKSADNGASWNSTGLQEGVHAVAVDPSASNVVYAGTEFGVLKSTDGAATWNPTGALTWSRVSSLQLNPASVLGGTSSTGTVTVSQAAPAGGTLVHLFSDKSTVAAVPATVTVPAGGTTGNFTITTQSLHPTDQDVTIWAGSGGVGRSAVLTVRPTDLAPDTAITSALDRQGVPIPNGGASKSTKITIHFTGTDDVGVAGFECSLDGGAFTPCTSPVTYQGFFKGQHTFRVRAVDSKGFRDPTPATFVWTRN